MFWWACRRRPRCSARVPRKSKRTKGSDSCRGSLDKSSAIRRIPLPYLVITELALKMEVRLEPVPQMRELSIVGPQNTTHWVASALGKEILLCQDAFAH